MKPSLLALVMTLLFIALATAQLARSDSSMPIVWNMETHLRLAQCYIAEADEHHGDWTAVSYAMLNWRDVRRRVYPQMRYLDIVRSTCSVHRLSASRRSRRQRWIRNLGLPDVLDDPMPRPEGFPSGSSWKRKRRYWIKALKHADSWRRGELRDPCRGRAIIWGAPRDPDNPWHLKTDDPFLKGYQVVRLACSDELENDYYRAMTRKEKREHEATTHRQRGPDRELEPARRAAATRRPLHHAGG